MLNDLGDMPSRVRRRYEQLKPLVFFTSLKRHEREGTPSPLTIRYYFQDDPYAIPPR